MSRIGARAVRRRAGGGPTQTRRPPLRDLPLAAFPIERMMPGREGYDSSYDGDGDQEGGGERLAWDDERNPWSTRTKSSQKATLALSGPPASGRHRLAIDLDFPVEVYASSTPGHHHLYIDRDMEWEDYVNLLTVLAEVGVLEEGYASASIERGFTALRLPWIKKMVSRESHEKRVAGRGVLGFVGETQVRSAQEARPAELKHEVPRIYGGSATSHRLDPRPPQSHIAANGA